ncbi:hepatitis A virus cellular receptor 2 [Sorex fumeus]|uniref:hepatitis A virus cellular receptor 2 n=1 Tax=Sorex fumeus TaxID=62283 RepID=UPI0024AD7336|nr:hepatitis A virus cellular receptor 2 [Sorex fumeus]
MFLPFAWVLLGLLWLAGAMNGAQEVEVGRDAHLPCAYAPGQPERLVPMCWGRGACPLRGCPGRLLRTDGRSVQEQADARYQLRGTLLRGDVSLTIERAGLGDSGPYCCRILFPGPMNDQKVTVTLTVRPAEAVLTTTVNRGFTIPWAPSAEGQSPGTETLELPRDRNGSFGATVASEPPPDAGVPLRTGLYIWAGVSAGFLLICSAVILIAKRLDVYRKADVWVVTRLITLTEEPPIGLAKRAVGEENIYTIEENVYEIEDPDENYSSIAPQPLD